MKDFFDEHNAIFHLLSFLSLIAVIIVLVITIMSQREQIALLTDKVTTMENNGSLTITMDQVNSAADQKIKEAIDGENEEFSAEVNKTMEDLIDSKLEGYKEDIYMDVYKQVTSDINKE